MKPLRYSAINACSCLRQVLYLPVSPVQSDCFINGRNALRPVKLSVHVNCFAALATCATRPLMYVANFKRQNVPLPLGPSVYLYPVPLCCMSI